MPCKVFISHSTQDQGLVTALANLLVKFGIEVSVAEWYLTPGISIDKKIFEQIENADWVVVLLTNNGIRSSWVQQEIGYALKTGKLLIPIVEKGTKTNALGALQGREYIEYDPLQPQQALLRASEYVKSLKLQKEEQQKNLLIVGGILAFFLLLSGGKR
ncbi:MAG: toll/interleukin-1 receptor domain-containing protein [candidate division KSB1 bacterium]|nr:toll/interleukin-1 receptor domain-containing protein [candidate division KSB1 bacterium]MDZ7303971.1 toll/interleukin-1 receptor domain-containing protein [candidate division KSB1 bacterium]MDZ7313683.1 toll/interleukin-1 receptor domain-containing protein [candidate division KSB1 bacterium]